MARLVLCPVAKLASESSEDITAAENELAEVLQEVPLNCCFHERRDGRIVSDYMNTRLWPSGDQCSRTGLLEGIGCARTLAVCTARFQEAFEGQIQTH